MGSTFRLEAPLRSSPRSIVWRAQQLPLGRPVVVKFFLVPEDDGRAREHLALELSRLRDLRHPNNLHLVDIAGHLEGGDHATAGHPFAVFEYVQGHTLRELLTQRRRMSPLQVWRIALQALGALSEAHEAGMLHRDVTPSNLMLWEPTGLEQHLKVIDYGVGHPVDPGSGPAARVVGTPHYLAPEIAQGSVSSPQRDLYALGVVLYEALAGRRPFEGPDRRAVLEAHVRGAPLPLAQLVPVPDDLAAIVHTAIARQPSDRFDSARAFLEELKALSWRKLSRYHFAEFAPNPEEEAIVTDIFEPQAWEAATGVLDDSVVAMPNGGSVEVHSPMVARLPLLSTGVPSIWVLADDPATRHASVAAAAGVLQSTYEVEVLDSMQRDRRLEQMLAGGILAPWVVVLGDLHTLVQDPLLTHLRSEVSTARLLLSTHLNGKMIQTTVNYVGLDQHVALPTTVEEVAAAVEKLVERARRVRHQQDQVRLALRDAQHDVERLRGSQSDVPPAPHHIHAPHEGHR